MNYVKIEKNSIANGIGIRTVLWCSGCSLHCKGCHNPETWDCSYGKEFDEQALKELLSTLKNDYVQGITYSGGHPLEDYNIKEITQIAKTIKESYPQKTQWLYTGLLWENIKDLPILNYIDVLVDGPYIDEQKDITLAFRGSKNQRVIDVQKSLKEDKVVLYLE